MLEHPPWLWIALTIVAAGAQTLRNAMQRELTQSLGTVAATHVRFLFGLPFAALASLIVIIVTGHWLPVPSLVSLTWTTFGAVAQIGGTALLLSAMQQRSFIVSIAYSKTEPVQVAIFGLVFLGDHLTAGLVAAIVLATAGVMIMSWPKPGASAALSWTSIWLGLGWATLFAVAAVGYRGGIMAMPEGSFVVRASTTLLIAIAIQTALLTAYLLLRDPAKLAAMLGAWRQSLWAGFLGAFASELWFLAFAIEQAAKVRTLALVEILFAQAISRRLMAERIAPREIAGVGLVIAGVILLLNLSKP